MVVCLIHCGKFLDNVQSVCPIFNISMLHDFQRDALYSFVGGETYKGRERRRTAVFAGYLLVISLHFD